MNKVIIILSPGRKGGIIIFLTTVIHKQKASVTLNQFKRIFALRRKISFCYFLCIFTEQILDYIFFMKTIRLK